MNLASQIASILFDFQNRHILVVGDVMLDRFVCGSVDRLSPEAPIPVLTQTEEHLVPGGAANVGRNLSGIGGQVSLIGCIGNDRAGQSLTDALSLSAQIGFFPIVCDDRPTTQKTRFLASGKQMLRVDDEVTRPLTDTQATHLLTQAESVLEVSEILIISDYAKGCLDPDIIKHLINTAHKKSIPVITDPKSSDFSIYRGSTVLTPNLSEFGQATGMSSVNHDSLAKAASALLSDYEYSNLLVTLGADGMLLVNETGYIHNPAYPCDVFDVSGAGDTVVAVIAASIACGGKPEDAMKLANLAASVVIGKSGTASLCPGEFIGAARPSTGETTLPNIVKKTAQWRNEHLRVGFTNGCFDLLHLGHLALLKQAKENCDFLIIGLNSDNSVKRLKGQFRPINDQGTRLKILESLEFVDEVRIFDDDTPYRLIKEISPDVLMKGGDYKENQIVGSEYVRSYGGNVLVLNFLPDLSTTKLLKKIKENKS